MKKLLTIIAAVFLLIIVVAAVSGGSDDTDTVAAGDSDTTEATDAEDGGNEPLTMSGNNEFPPADDVTITDCAEEFGFANIKLEITNHSPKASNYTVDVSLVDAEGVVVGSAMAAHNGLRPDQTARTEAVGTVEEGAAFTCELNSVERYSAEG